jgi:hypothetical protein
MVQNGTGSQVDSILLQLAPGRQQWQLSCPVVHQLLCTLQLLLSLLLNPLLQMLGLAQLLLLQM